MVPSSIDLLSRVDDLFVASNPRGWDTPDSAGDDAYSRMRDPEKYAITQQRAVAWIEALVEAGVATAAEREERHPSLGSTTTTALTPTEAGARAVEVLVTRDHLPGLAIWPVGAPVLLALVPFCGCDHCDDGSATLLDEIDAAFVSLMDGTARLVDTSRSAGSVQATADGDPGGPAQPRLAGPPREVWTTGPWLARRDG